MMRRVGPFDWRLHTWQCVLRKLIALPNETAIGLPVGACIAGMAFVDAETGRLDSVTANMLSGGEWGAKNAADMTKQALSAKR